MSSLVLQRTHALGPQRCGGQTASRPGPLPIAPRACFSGNSHSRFERSTNQIGPQVLWRTERKCPHVSTSATATENAADDFDDEDLEDIGLGGGEVEAIDESQLGPLPEVRHQGAGCDDQFGGGAGRGGEPCPFGGSSTTRHRNAASASGCPENASESRGSMGAVPRFGSQRKRAT